MITVTEPELIGQCLDRLQPLESVYPGFRVWFATKVVPGLGDGTRRMFAVLHEDVIVGIVVAKKSDERKICTLWVEPSHRNRGIGVRLLRTAMDWLGTDRPLASAPESQRAIHQLMTRLGFLQTSVRPRPCCPEEFEIFYNELDTKEMQ